MSERKLYSTKKILASAMWALLGIGTVVLLSAAIIEKNNRKCSGVEIYISGVQNNFFIDKKQVNDLLEILCGSKIQGRKINSFNLAEMENTLRKNQWIRSAELFFDNNELLTVNINEREPVARIFTKAGTSFYIDSSVTLLPLSSRSSARVPVFTNFPAVNTLSKTDSNLLADIQKVSGYILHNDFWMAQIDQVDITPERTFEMVPKVGNHIIIFGTAENYEEKFDHLLNFYQQVALKTGWNKYSKINVQYKDQVVAVKRNAKDIIEDSLKARQLMQAIVTRVQNQALDSTGNIQLVQPLDDNNIPLPPVTEDVPEEQVNDRSVIPNPLPSSIEKPNPTLDHREKTAVPPPKRFVELVKKPLQKQVQTTILKKPNATNHVLSAQQSKGGKAKAPVEKKLIIKQTDKPKSKPRPAPNNDY